MRPPRLQGFSYTGSYAYSLTICTSARRRAFTTDDLVQAVHEEFRRTATEEHFEIWAHCFMEDHAHLLVLGQTDNADVRMFVSTAKQRAAYAARPWIRGRLWQRGYHEHVLRGEEDLIDVARYIVQNPVRAGLVTSPTGYPYCGSDMLSLEDLCESVIWKPDWKRQRR